jgi:thiopeptide-type bacteriocin biosynthesis protein
VKQPAREQPLEVRIESSGFFAVRRPLLAFDEIIDFGDGLEAAALAGAERARLEAALASDRRILRARLQRLLARPEVREAIWLASPHLDEGLALWQREPDGKRGRAVESAVVRYFLRMAGRATPFGLFSGAATGRRGDRSEIVVEPRRRLARHTRLDMQYLCSLVRELERRPEIRSRLRFHPNSGLYAAGNRLRYPEGRLRDGMLSYHLVTVEATDYLLATLERAEAGVDPATLAGLLGERDAEVTADEARDYVDALIDAQILVSDLQPAVTGPEPIHELVGTLRSIPGAAGTVDTLERVQSELQKLDAEGLGAPPERYRSIAGMLRDLPGPVDETRLFQVDLVAPGSAITLHEDVLQEVLRGVMLLARIVARPERANLARFREAFGARYEDREVPLVEVLDDDLGIGFGAGQTGPDASPLLAGIGFPGGSAPTGPPWTFFHGHMLDKLLDASARRSPAVELSREDLQALGRGREARMPAAFSMLVVLAARSNRALAAGDFKILFRWGQGPSGARLLGRFCHADTRLHREVEAHLRAEEATNPDAVFAEVVHLPQGRLGNVLLRPVLRSHELPFLGRSGAPRDRQIPVSDLLVSVRGDRILLRSRRLDRQIVPRLTTAHNFMYDGLPLYRFLCMLQEQNAVAGFSWEWGPLESASYLPRVTSGRLVLQRARWSLTPADIRGHEDNDEVDRFRAFQSLREERGMPRFMTVAEADNELLVDADNPLSVAALFSAVRNRPSVRLVEMFPAPDEMPAEGPEGRFVHELVVPFVCRPAPRAAGAAPAVKPPALEHGAEAPRRFPAGSEWLYAKLYCGNAMADPLLREAIGPLSRRLLDGGACDRWFFIRYSDPEPHLRVRFHGAPQRLVAEALPALREQVEPLLADGRVWKLQLDVYEREFERYGGPAGVLVAEEVFQADSEAVLALVAMTEGDEGSEWRWRLALLGLDELLADFGYDAGERLRFVTWRRDVMAAEMRLEKPTHIQLGERFRARRRDLEGLLFDGRAETDERLAEVRRVLRTRSGCLAPAAQRLRSLEEQDRLEVTTPALAASFTHMHVNRLLRSEQKTQELVLYDFLARLYASQAARARSACTVRDGS